MNLIICGSRKYNIAPLDKIVDSFNVVIRNNMLLHDDGYGTKEADIQVMNCHVYNHYITSASYEKWEQTYLAEHGIDPKHLKRFYNFVLNAKNTEFVYFDNNNTPLLNKILFNNNINFAFTKQLRCGLGGTSHFIDLGKKPFLIGFSITDEQDKTHAYNSLQTAVSTCHNPPSEHKIIELLHNQGLIDASLCTLLDRYPLEFDGTLEPTEYCLNLIQQINLQEQ